MDFNSFGLLCLKNRLLKITYCEHEFKQYLITRGYVVESMWKSQYCVHKYVGV